MTHRKEDDGRISILIVDDKKENLLALEGWLGDFDINIVKAMSGNEALERLLEDDFALVLLDVQGMSCKMSPDVTTEQTSLLIVDHRDENLLVLGLPGLTLCNSSPH